MGKFLLKGGQENVLENVLAGQRFDHTKTTTENDIWEFLDELSTGKKIQGFIILPSKKAILTNGLLSPTRDTPYSTTHKGINSLLIYMLIRDKQKYHTEYEKPNFKLEDINALLNDCIDTTTVSETDYSSFRRLIEKFSEDSNFGKCTLEPNKNGQSIRLVKVIEEEKTDDLIKGYTKHTSVNFDEMPLELYHLREYEKDANVTEWLLLKIIRGLPLWLKKIFFKEEYGKLPQIGDSQLVRQKIEYYIPVEFEFLGNEYDKLSDKEVKRLQKKVENGLLDYLWNNAIMGRNAKYFFVFSGIGQGKTSLLVKLYIQYHRFIFDSINERVIGYFNIDDSLETKLDIFNQQVKYLNQTKGKIFEKIVLLDALDEDYEVNINLSKRLDDLKKILDDYDCAIITCRTQFFDSQKDIDREIRDRFGDVHTRIAYIRKFKPKQIDKYLKKRYGFRTTERKASKELITKYCDKNDFISQPLLLSFMDLLVRHKAEERLEIRYKTQLYKYIIDRWQEKEASKISSSPSYVGNYKNKVYDVAHQVAINIYKRDVVKMANLKNKSHEIENILSNEELTKLLEGIDKKILEIKKRSVFMRDSIGNWLFIHKSFLEFFIGHAAYQIQEFDTIFEYPKGFDSSKKKYQNSASFFYTELMLFKIRGLARQLNTFVINQENSRKRSKSFQHITQSDIVKTNLLYTNDHKYEVFQRESVSLISFIRCFKNLKRNVDLSLAKYEGSLSILGNMRYLEVLILADSENPINFKEFSRFPLLENITIRDSFISNIFNLSNLPKLITFNVHGGEILDKNFSFQSNSIENLVLSAPIHSLKFLRNCPNIKNLSVTKYSGNDLSPISELSKLKNVDLNNVTVDGIKVLYQLCQKGNLQNISLEYDNITDEIFEAINLIKDKVVHLRFYGIRLDKKQVEAFYRDNLLYLNRQGIDNQNYSYKSIEKLRTISPNIIKNICVVFQGKYHYVSMDWRKKWIIQFEAPNQQFTQASIAELSIYQFETIIMAWYIINDFEVINDFKNLKLIYVSYVPTEKQLKSVFRDMENRKSLCIAYTQNYDLNLASFNNLYFDEFEIREHKGKIYNLQMLQTCNIDKLTFDTMPMVELGHITQIRGLREIHIHNIYNINNLAQFLISTMYPFSSVMDEEGNITVSGFHIGGKGICMPNCGIQSQHLPIFEVCGKTDINKDEYGSYGTIGMFNLHNNQLTSTNNFKKLKPIFKDNASIKLDNNPITDITSFNNYNIGSLSLKDCNIQNIPYFEKTTINKLNLMNNPLKNIDGLCTIQELSILELGTCFYVSNFECISNLKSLKTIKLGVSEEQLQKVVAAIMVNKSIKEVYISYSIKTSGENCQKTLEPIKHLLRY